MSDVVSQAMGYLFSWQGIVIAAATAYFLHSLGSDLAKGRNGD